MSYVLPEPMVVPSGSRVEIHTEFDNFETNPRARKGETAKGRYGLALEYEEPRVQGADLIVQPITRVRGTATGLPARTESNADLRRCLVTRVGFRELSIIPK